MHRLVLLLPCVPLSIALTAFSPLWWVQTVCAVRDCEAVYIVNWKGSVEAGILFTNELGDLRAHEGLASSFDARANSDGTIDDILMKRWIRPSEIQEARERQPA